MDAHWYSIKFRYGSIGMAVTDEVGISRKL